jgi:hypothetical protein
LKQTRFNTNEAVKLLKIKYPNPIPGQTSGGPYDRLSRSTLDSWIVDLGPVRGKALKPDVERTVEVMGTYEPEEVFRGRMGLNRGNAKALEGQEELEKELVQLLHSMREAGQPLNSAVIQAVMKGVIEAKAPQLLRSYGGQWEVSRAWVKRWVGNALDWTFRAPTTAAQKLPKDWEMQVDHLAYRAAFLVHSYGIPAALAVNMDQTGMHLVPTGGSRTYEKKGRKEIAVTGTEDKRQITIVVSSAADGTTLPPQLIFPGKTARSLPAGPAVQLAKLAGPFMRRRTAGVTWSPPRPG